MAGANTDPKDPKAQSPDAIIAELQKQLQETAAEKDEAVNALQEKTAADKAALGITPELENYKVPKGEEKHAHLLVEQPSYQDGKKTSSPFVHKLNEPAYRQFIEHLKSMNFKIILELHIPKGWKTPEQMQKHLAEVAAKKRKASKAGK